MVEEMLKKGIEQFIYDLPVSTAYGGMCTCGGGDDSIPACQTADCAPGGRDGVVLEPEPPAAPPLVKDLPAYSMADPSAKQISSFNTINSRYHSRKVEMEFRFQPRSARKVRFDAFM